MIAPSEVTYDPDAFIASGSPFPSREGSLRTTMSFGGRVSISAQADHRGGQELLNEVALRRCWFEPRCVEQHDPATPLAAQAAAVAARANSRMVSEYIEDASYTKLREVSVAIALPRQWAAMAGTSRARLTLTGRNLFTWTSYSGLDPEIISTAYDGVLASGGFYQPPLRSFAARVDLSW